MRSKMKILGSIGFALIMASYAAASSGNVLESSRDHRVVECEPGSIPETSILDKTEKDIQRILNPDGYREKYPGECSIWTGTSVVEGNSKHTYRVEVMKYTGDDWKALITVTRDGEGVAYTGVDVGDRDVGATDANGQLKTRLPENFTISIETSGGPLELEGSTK